MDELIFPDIFTYDNPLSFLKEIYFYEQKKVENFKLKDFASILGFKSHSSLQMILSGSRKISSGFVKKFAHVYGLNRAEKLYFELLIELSKKALDQNESKLAQKKLEQLNKLKDRVKPLEKISNLKKTESYDFLTKPVNGVVSEYLERKNNNLSDASKILKGGFSSEEVENAILILKNIGLIKDSKNGGYERIFETVMALDDKSENMLMTKHLGVKAFKEFSLKIWEETDYKDIYNHFSWFYLNINEELINDAHRFINYKLKEFLEKFEAKPNTSDKTVLVYFNLESLTK